MKSTFEFALVALVVASVVGIVNGACTINIKKVSNADEFKNALATAKPGDNIMLLNNSYDVPNKEFLMQANGEKDCPITISTPVRNGATIVGRLNLTSSSYVNIYNITLFGNDEGIRSEGGKFLTIENVTATNKEERGIECYQSSNVVIRNCTFVNMGFAGVHLKGTYDSTVEKCTFGDNIWTFALWLDHGSSNNVMNDNIFCGNGYDVLLTSWVNIGDKCTNNELSRNFFVNPNGGVMQNGVWCLDSAENNLFKENFMVVNAGPVGGYGFRVGLTHQRVCASNKIFGNATPTDAQLDYSC